MSDEKPPSPTPDEVAAIKRSLSAIGTEVLNIVQTLAPTEAQEHFQNAHVEVLKGLRVLIDRRIDRLSSPRPRGTSIKVE